MLTHALPLIQRPTLFIVPPSDLCQAAPSVRDVGVLPYAPAAEEDEQNALRADDVRNAVRARASPAEDSDGATSTGQRGGRRVSNASCGIRGVFHADRGITLLLDSELEHTEVARIMRHKFAWNP